MQSPGSLNASHWSTPTGKHDINATGKRAQRAYAEMRQHEKEKIRRELRDLERRGQLNGAAARLKHNVPVLDLQRLRDVSDTPGTFGSSPVNQLNARAAMGTPAVFSGPVDDARSAGAAGTIGGAAAPGGGAPGGGLPRVPSRGRLLGGPAARAFAGHVRTKTPQSCFTLGAQRAKDGGGPALSRGGRTNTTRNQTLDWYPSGGGS